ncbi:MAG: YdaU family protein, partial [Paracoccus sp. (in: a-proteobacteria)]
MSDSPFFQFYPSDWLAGTRGLTAAETGVYITLVAMMYEAEGPIQADMKRLARLCGSTPSAFKKTVGGLISTGKLSQDDRGFFNGRVEIEIEKRSEKRSSASASANARWKKTVKKQSTKNAKESSSLCERNANPKTVEIEDTNVYSKNEDFFHPIDEVAFGVS